MKSKPANLLLLVAVLFFTSLAAQTKYALIFAISKYESKSWRTLHSSTDAAVLKNTFIRQGFSPGNVRVIQDARAKYQGIVDTLNAFINSSLLKQGDVVVIHFSAHGQQLEDNNGDEIADGLDESIVSYDAVYDANPANFKKVQANYFRDDEFGSILQRLRAKLGKNGDVLVIIDACHSGTGTKGTAVVRGDKPKLVSTAFNPAKWDRTDTTGVFKESKTSNNENKDLSTCVIISAARSEEVNWETDDNDLGPMGSLSNAIMKVFEKLDTGITYRSLFSKIQSIMNKTVPGQHPVLEGDGMDRKLFGGAFISQKTFIEINSIEGKKITFKAGILSGLDEGAKIVIVKADTPDPAEAAPLASGTVIKGGNYSATVMLDKVLNIQPAQGWAFIKEPVFKTEPVVLKIDPGFPGAALSEIQAALKELPLFKTGGDPELILKKGQQSDSILIASNGYLFATIKNISAGSIKEKLQRYAQYKLLRDFEITDPDANAEIRLVPVKNKRPDITKINSKLVNGIYEYKTGDTLVLWVKNTGKLPVYFNVIDLQPDGDFRVILPRQGIIEPEELRINGGDSTIIKGYFIKIGPPCGTEIFKVFVSKEPINMETATKTPGLKGSFTPLENLVSNSYQAATKGPQKKNVSSAEGTVYNLLFRIVSCKK